MKNEEGRPEGRVYRAKVVSVHGQVPGTPGGIHELKKLFILGYLCIFVLVFSDVEG
jgi:hypothetical protein